MSGDDVTMKGTRDGLLVIFPESQPFEALRYALQRKLAEAGGFFEGGSVTIDVGRRILTSKQLLQLDRLVSQEHDMDVLRIVNSGRQRDEGEEGREFALETAAAAPSGFGDEPVSMWGEGASGPRAHGHAPATAGRPRPAGGPTGAPPPASEPPARPRPRRRGRPPVRPSGRSLPAGRASKTRSVVIRGTVRSGQSVHFRGSVVVIGDVNPGAEVVAKGDVIVLGRLRGVVHAGAMGDRAAVVAAYRLEPTQLRIGEVITRPPEGDARSGAQIPEVARVEDGAVVIDSYQELAQRAARLNAAPH